MYSDFFIERSSQLTRLSLFASDNRFETVIEHINEAIAWPSPYL